MSLNEEIASESPSDKVIEALGASLLAPSASTGDVSLAVDQLHGTVSDHKRNLDSSIRLQWDVVQHHVAGSSNLGAASLEVEAALNAVTRDFDVHTAKNVPQVADFVSLSSALAASKREQAVASSTTAALKAIQRRYCDLSEIEDAVWSGRCAAESLLRHLDLSTPQSPVEVPSLVTSAVSNRVTLLRTAVSEQLIRGWNDAVSLSTSGETSSVLIKHSVRLQPPTAPRITGNLKTPPTLGSTKYSVPLLTTAMDRLDILSDQLHDLQRRLLNHVIQPLLIGQEASTTVDEQASTLSVRPTTLGHLSPIDVVRHADAVVRFIADELRPRSSEVPVPAEVDRFLASFREAVFKLILSDILIPSMPATCTDLPGWLLLVRESVACENEGGSGGVLATFLTKEAGQRWLANFRRTQLRQARDLSFRSWSSASYREVELPNQISTTAPELSASLPVGEPLSLEDQGPAGDVEEGMAVAEADGWGFDDEPSNKLDDASDDGWGFEETAQAEATQHVAALKPVKQAKRVGKRGANKNSARDVDSSSPSPPPPPSPPAATPHRSADALKPKNQKEVAPRKITKPPALYRVSTVCDAVLRHIKAVQDEVLRMADVTEPAFKDVCPGMLEVLNEQLDFIRATTPLALGITHAGQDALALRLSNDYLYIAANLSSDEHQFAWAGRKRSVQDFESTGKTIYRAYEEKQRAIIASFLHHAGNLVDMSHDVNYARAEEAIAGMVGHFEELAAQVQVATSTQQSLPFLGKIVEYTVVQLVSDITALDDITEVESDRLASMMTQVEALDDLFKEGASSSSSVAAHVPHWLKFCYITEILRANLIDITYLFESGSLVDFSSAELSKLVQALFADSPKRKTLLNKIAAPQLN